VIGLDSLFSKFVKQYILPLASNTQGVEARIKDVSFWKTTGKSESIIINISTLRSGAVKDVTKRTRKDPKYTSREKNDEKNKNYLPGKTYNANMLKHAFTFYPEKGKIDQEELTYIKDLLDKKNNFSSRKISRTVTAFNEAARKRGRRLGPFRNKIT